MVLAQPAWAQEVHEIRNALARLQPENSPPVDREVTLPHRWDHAYPRQGGSATYELALPDWSASVPHALYLPRAGNQLEILHNGHPIFRHGELGDSDSDAAKPPLWIALPPSSGTEVQTLTVRASMQQGRWGGMTQVFMGPADSVRELYLVHYRWRQWGAVGVVVAMAVAAVLAIGLWYLQHEAVYASFAIAAVTGVLRFADRVIETPPLPWPGWGALMAVAFAMHVLWLLRFSLELVGLDSPRWRLALRALMAFTGVVALAAFHWRQPSWWTGALATLAAASAVGTLQVIQLAWRQRTREALGLSVAGSIAVLAGVRDWWDVRVHGDGAVTFSILPHATIAFVLLMGWLVMDRFARQGRQLRALTESLDQQVKAREQELRLSYDALRRESEQRAALGERQRIMRDIHDGVGAQLVGLVNLLRKEHVPPQMLRQHADAALDELRMAVDAMHNIEGDLPTLLASMRYRLQDRFNACGITLDWQIDDHLPLANVGPQQLVQVQRIVLESFTNILKHADATRIRVKVSARADQGLDLQIDDNGQGLPSNPPAGQGHGLRNMRMRAQSMGARLEIRPSPEGGVRVALSLPPPGHVPDAAAAPT